MQETKEIQLTKEETESVVLLQASGSINDAICLRPRNRCEKKVTFSSGIEALITIADPFEPTRSNDPAIQYSLWENGDTVAVDDHRPAFIGRHELRYKDCLYTLVIHPDPEVRKIKVFYKVPDTKGDRHYLVTLSGVDRDIVTEVDASSPYEALETACNYFADNDIQFYFCDYYEFMDAAPDGEHYSIGNLYIPVEGTRVEELFDATGMLSAHIVSGEE